jgi:hypothetical protein
MNILEKINAGHYTLEAWDYGDDNESAAIYAEEHIKETQLQDVEVIDGVVNINLDRIMRGFFTCRPLDYVNSGRVSVELWSE